MKELKPITNISNYFHDFLEYGEPLLEYVSILAEEIKPATKEDFECGYPDSKATGTFATRYFNNNIDVKRLNDYLKDIELLKIITDLGYDTDKFWYLLLFIYDYSCGLCIKGIKKFDTPEEQIHKLISGIIDIAQKESDEIIFKTPIKIILEREGKHKIIIDNSTAIIWLAGACIKELETVEAGSNMTKESYNLNLKDGSLKDGSLGIDSTTKSAHLWYFTKLFNTFFKLNPPIKLRGNTSKSYNKTLLISKLIYIIGFPVDDRFTTSEEYLKGYLKQPKDFKITNLNGIYL